jgi:hypothetical protein
MEGIQQMKIVPLELADFDLVEIMTTNDCLPTPHCKKHGAMNKITKHESGGGHWRCISVVSDTTVVDPNNPKALGKKENDCVCRAGCIEVR